MKQSEYPPAYYAWLVWGLGAVFYCYGFFQRVAPAVMADQLMADFGIGAASLGNLSAFYFYSYVAMQVPTGILADSLGPRRLLAAGATGAAVGTILFSFAPDFLLASLGRLVIGASVAVAWVVLLKLSTHWFPPNKFAMVTGFALFCGLAGAVWAGVPLRILMDEFGWRKVMGVAGAGTFLVAAAIWAMVRDDPSERGFRSYAPAAREKGGGNDGRPKKSEIREGIKEVFRHGNTWLLTLAPGGIVGPALAFAGLWGVPFLTTHYGLTPAQSAGVTSTLMISWGIGGPVLGAISDRIGLRKPLYFWGNVVATAGWFLMLYVPNHPMWLLIALSIVVGLASGGIIVGFAFVKESVPVELAGTVSGVCNMGVMTGPMLLQPAMGGILDFHWDGLLRNGVRIYDLEAYRWAFSLMLGWSVLACVLVGLARETGWRAALSKGGENAEIRD